MPDNHINTNRLLLLNAIRFRYRCCRLLVLVIPCAATFLAGACSDTRKKMRDKLYGVTVESGWPQESTFIANKPAVLFRVVHKGGLQYVLPISTMGTGTRPLRMSQRGWRALDSMLLRQGNPITPVRDGRLGSPVLMQQGMWQNPEYPLDTAPGCPGVMVPLGQVPIGTGVDLAVTNYKQPSGLRSVSAATLQQAISQVPLLVTPTMGVSAAMLSRYRRNVHQISRVGAPASVLLEYNDPDPKLDTGSFRGKRPRQLIVVLDTGVYGYRPSWVYQTTRMRGDYFPLRFLDAIDVNNDGTPELFFAPDLPDVSGLTMSYRRWNETWRESWRRTPLTCDLAN